MKTRPQSSPTVSPVESKKKPSWKIIVDKNEPVISAAPKDSLDLLNQSTTETHLKLPTKAKSFPALFRVRNGSPERQSEEVNRIKERSKIFTTAAKNSLEAKPSGRRSARK